jgi:uncharacterized protein (DUF1800 family)
MSKMGTWEPYVPTRDDPWDLRKVAHLHRRAGFGATWTELQRDLKAGPNESVERLLQPRQATGDETETLQLLRRDMLASNDIERLKAWWLYRILYDPDRLREKLTLFWHNHFATSNAKVQSVPFMLQQNETLRRHALGDFAALLRDIAADPAMLVWLDGGSSTKDKPNENFAREFLELFTLGVGHYTEPDIREAARAFTGWAKDRDDTAQQDEKLETILREMRRWQREEARYDPAQHDDGAKTFLKETGRWQAADIVRITLRQPAAAEFVCRKLYRFFVTDHEEPNKELLQPLAEELRREYSIGHVVSVILRSRHFYSEGVSRRLILSPVEFSAGLLRTLDVPQTNVRLLALAAICAQQGQDLFYPPNVKGWDGGRTWINSLTTLARSNWVADVVWGKADLDMKAFDPVAWAKSNRLPPKETAAGLIDLILQGDLAPEARQMVLHAARDGQPQSLRKALQLLLHCPECQLA